MYHIIVPGKYTDCFSVDRAGIFETYGFPELKSIEVQILLDDFVKIEHGFRDYLSIKI
jgi:hypothetical protein